MKNLNNLKNRKMILWIIWKKKLIRKVSLYYVFVSVRNELFVKKKLILIIIIVIKFRLEFNVVLCIFICEIRFNKN